MTMVRRGIGFIIISEGVLYLAATWAMPRLTALGAGLVGQGQGVRFTVLQHLRDGDWSHAVLP